MCSSSCSRHCTRHLLSRSQANTTTRIHLTTERPPSTPLRPALLPLHPLNSCGRKLQTMQPCHAHYSIHSLHLSLNHYLLPWLIPHMFSFWFCHSPREVRGGRKRWAAIVFLGHASCSRASFLHSLNSTQDSAQRNSTASSSQRLPAALVHTEDDQCIITIKWNFQCSWKI